MPNHCHQILKFIFHGPNGADQIKKIKDAVWDEENSGFAFEKIIPPPENMFRGTLGEKEKAECKAQGIPNWYDWQTENWGVKWGAYDSAIINEDSWNIGFRFTTAWHIPDPIIDKIFTLFPGVNIEYVAADDGGWIAYHRSINDEGEVSEENFKDVPGVQSALFTVLNTSY